MDACRDDGNQAFTFGTTGKGVGAMVCRRSLIRCIVAVAALALFLCAQAETGDSRYVGHFTTRQYCDAVNTTELWDTVEGVPELPSVELTLVGSYNTAGNARGVAVSGDYAYVADQYSGLVVIDISDPTDPSLAGSYDTAGQAFGVAVSGDYAYVADYTAGLVVIDISDPTTPSLAGSYDTDGLAHAVAVSGDYAYVADHSGGLVVMDISDPTDPSFLAANTPGWVVSVLVSGEHAYVTTGSGMAVIDTSDPMDPSFLGICLFTNYGDYLARRVSLSGDYAYMSNGFAGLEVIDISDPTNPSLVTTSTPPWVSSVLVSGEHAYITTKSGLVAMDISDPTDPSFVDICLLPSPGPNPSDYHARRVVLSGDYAYVSNNYKGLAVIRIVEVLPSVVDVDPNTLNLKSEGNYATTYIELPEGCDPADIDVSTVTFEDVLPAMPSPTSVGDYDGDNIPDLMVKFNRGAVISLLSDSDGSSLWLSERGEDTAPLNHGDEFEVTVSGYLADGRMFSGADVIRVINPGNGSDDATILSVCPSPLNTTASISYEVLKEGHVSLRVYDVAGRMVCTLVSGHRAAGRHEITWDRKADDNQPVANGVYFLRLEQRGQAWVEKALVVN